MAREGRQKMGLESLPDECLAEVLSYLRSLDMLLVCKRWCRVALEDCPAWWRSVKVLGGAYTCLKGTRTCGFQSEGCSQAVQLVLLKPAVLAGFMKVAPHFRQLNFSDISSELQPLVPQLLAVASRYSLKLEGVELSIELEDKQACKVAFEAIGGMGALKSLVFDPMTPADTVDIPFSYLSPLSALTRLCHLDMCLDYCSGSLPSTILPRLQCLTHLGLNFDAPAVGPPQRVSLGDSASGSARLRVLRLSNALLLPEEATPASLGQLEELYLLGACPVPTGLPPMLHSLSGLTRLELDNDVHRADNGLPRGPAGAGHDEWCLQLLAGCSQLRALKLHRGAVVRLEVPPGALRHLVNLSVEDQRAVRKLCMAGSWANLPSLECLHLAGRSVYGITCPSGGLSGLRRLDMRACDFDWEHCQLTFPHLTWLAMSDVSLQRGPPPKRILRRLRQLSVQPSYFRSGLQTGMQHFPRNLNQATSLEVLELKDCGRVMLREVDAKVLEQLKSLRRLEVPICQQPWVMEFLRKQLPELEIIEITGSVQVVQWMRTSEGMMLIFGVYALWVHGS